LASVLNDGVFAAGPADSFSPSRPHFAPRAKNVIYIHLVGGPSHLELFDFKPELVRHNGEKCPDHMFKGKQLAFIRDHPTLLGDHGSTFGGNMLTTAAAYAGTKFLIDNDIPGKTKEMEPYLLGRLNDLKDRFSFVAEVRGKGLLAAMEFESDISPQVLTAANEAGLLLNAPRPTTIRFMPPLTVTREEIDGAVERLGNALATI